MTWADTAAGVLWRVVADGDALACLIIMCAFLAVAARFEVRIDRDRDPARKGWRCRHLRRKTRPGR